MWLHKYAAAVVCEVAPWQSQTRFWCVFVFVDRACLLRFAHKSSSLFFQAANGQFAFVKAELEREKPAQKYAFARAAAYVAPIL